MVECQARNPLKIAHVAGHEHKLILHRCGRNQKIVVVNRLTLPSQLPSNVGKPSHGRFHQRQDLHPLSEPTKNAFALLWVPTVIDAFVNLAVGDQADRQPLTPEASQQINGVLFPLEVIHHHIAIDQIAHRITGGRDDC